MDDSVTYLDRLAWLFWLLGIAYLCVYIFTSSHLNVDVIYLNAGKHWLEGKPLYDGSGQGFVYFPQSAALFSLFTLLPYKMAAILLRVLYVAFLSLGLWYFRLTLEVRHKSLFLVMSLICYIIALGALKLAQLNVVVSIFSLFSVICIAHERWSMASFLMVLSIIIKPTMAPFFLVFVVLYPVKLRVTLFLIIGFIFPFILQSPSYVMSQYIAYIQYYHVLVNTTTSTGWANLLGVFNILFGIEIPNRFLPLVSVVFGILTFFICLYCKKHFSHKIGILLIYTFCACFLMLFNPRTENNAYIILAPAIVWLAYYYMQHHHNTIIGLMTFVMLLFMVFNFPLSNAFLNGMPFIRPLVTLLVVVQLVYMIYDHRNSIFKKHKLTNQGESA